jgi:hypothetical protein
MGPEVSGHGHLAPLLWTWGEEEHHDGENVVEQSCSPHGGQEEGVGEGQDTFQRHDPATYFFQPGPTFQFQPPPSNAIKL